MVTGNVISEMVSLDTIVQSAPSGPSGTSSQSTQSVPSGKTSLPVKKPDWPSISFFKNPKVTKEELSKTLREQDIPFDKNKQKEDYRSLVIEKHPDIKTLDDVVCLLKKISPEKKNKKSFDATEIWNQLQGI